MQHHAIAALKRRLLVAGLVAACWSAAALAAEAESFASPDQAVAALVAAARANDTGELLKIFGSAGEPLVSSGDPIADKEGRARFVDLYGKGEKLEPEGADKATLVIGPEDWPFPIPLVRQAGSWHFDTAAGAEEILSRRIGRNELSAIEVCRAYAQAQRDYAADLAAAHQPVEYAQKFLSAPGKHDGLYWPVQSGEKESPIGPLMASARAEGYAAGADRGESSHSPYHGYYYKILTRQGPAAPGGARDYIVDGHMTGGFAMIAFPATYRDSGVKTFIINQNGLVYEKDLGPDTATAAAGIAEFNPDLSWSTR
jgi:hypothetical protein